VLGGRVRTRATAAAGVPGRTGAADEDLVDAGTLAGGTVTGTGVPGAEVPGSAATGVTRERSVEPAVPYNWTAGGITGVRRPPSARRPSSPDAAMTVIAAIETVASAAKLARDRCAPAFARFLRPAAALPSVGASALPKPTVPAEPTEPP
jgi:hypothetical protein